MKTDLLNRLLLKQSSVQQNNLYIYTVGLGLQWEGLVDVPAKQPGSGASSRQVAAGAGYSKARGPQGPPARTKQCNAGEWGAAF